MVYLLKGGRSSTKSLQGPTYEDRLLGYDGKTGAIEKGALIDKDIDFILNSNDPTLKGALDKKYRKEKGRAKHAKELYGNAVDNLDNAGNPYKDTDLSSPITAPTSGKRDVKRMQNILKENL